MPWSMNNRRPIVAPGWMSMPVTKRPKLENPGEEQGPAATSSQRGAEQHGVEPRIGEHHLQARPGGRISGHDGINFVSKVLGTCDPS